MYDYLVVFHPEKNTNTLPIVIKSKSEEEVNNYLFGNTNILYTIFNLDEEEIKTYKIVKNELKEVQEKDEDEIKGIYRVQKVTYSIHKKNGEKILKASYNFRSEKGWVWSSEYLSFDKTGYPRTKAIEWLTTRLQPDYINVNAIHQNNPKIDTESVYAMRDIFETPKQVEIEMNKQGYPKVVAEIWGY